MTAALDATAVIIFITLAEFCLGCLGQINQYGIRRRQDEPLAEDQAGHLVDQEMRWHRGRGLGLVAFAHGIACAHPRRGMKTAYFSLFPPAAHFAAVSVDSVSDP